VLDEGTIVENLAVTEMDRARHPATLALLNALPAPPDVLLRYRDRQIMQWPTPTLAAG
jgi:hypothetical protein